MTLHNLHAGRRLLIHELRSIPGCPAAIPDPQLHQAIVEALVPPHRDDDGQVVGAAFDFLAFTRSLSAQGCCDASAYSAGTLLEGIDVSVEFEPQPGAAEGRAARDYSVVARLGRGPDALCAQSPIFRLPEFRGAGGEPFRIDSDHGYRAPGQRHAQIRRGATTPLTARLIEGEWRGAFFIYGFAHRQDHAACLATAGAGLQHAILPVLTRGLHCDIYRPEGYAYGVWRVDLHLPVSAIQSIGRDPFGFQMPNLPQRMLVPDLVHRVALPLATGLIHNGVWRAELRSNGVAEDENPTPIAHVRRELLAAVDRSLRRAGWSYRTSTVLGLPVPILM